SDTGNHRVVSYDALLQDRRTFGKRGTAADEFTSPIGIAAAPSGAIYVADVGNQRIRILGPAGEDRGAIAFPGWTGNTEPGLAVDADGTLYATDPAGAAVVVLDAKGAVRSRITADDSDRKLANPTGVAIDRKTRILYVVNSGNASIAKISLAER